MMVVVIGGDGDLSHADWIDLFARVKNAVQTGSTVIGSWVSQSSAPDATACWMVETESEDTAQKHNVRLTSIAAEYPNDLLIVGQITDAKTLPGLAVEQGF